ncbi:ESPR-type extended signal peptide-containing protein [Haemophilus haemolyticus]|uniref:ESPR-type extended signal peptide-containing protein n=1 Tax=Haemophilus haemolyticus TaxID=726 RepID=UPI000E58DA5F|nr:ESPR-type extended signal peptide-containing protein [Haemophilus haemolyticus]
MNHIYKVIWNTIIQTWVAVSELSRAKGKTKSSKTLSAVALAAISIGTIVGNAEGAEAQANSVPFGTINNEPVPRMDIGTNNVANNSRMAAYARRARPNTGHTVIFDAGSITIGNTKVNNEGITITPENPANGKTLIALTDEGLNNGGNKIIHVAPGKDGTDAVNVNQLKYVAGNISNQINNVDKDLRAGIAGTLASGGLYHVTTAGKSMVSVGAGTYRGQNALAVGYSRLSNNGKVGVKFTVNSNSQGHAGASASVGYQW